MLRKELRSKTLGQMRRLVANKIDRAYPDWARAVRRRSQIHLYIHCGRPVMFMSRRECMAALGYK